MPLGSRYEEVGLLLSDRSGLVLCRDDGGVWRLDGAKWVGDHAGRRVALTGIRSGFDLLEVETVDGCAPRRAWMLSWEFGLGVLVTLTTLAGMVAAISRS